MIRHSSTKSPARISQMAMWSGLALIGLTAVSTVLYSIYRLLSSDFLGDPTPVPTNVIVVTATVAIVGVMMAVFGFTLSAVRSPDITDAGAADEEGLDTRAA